jgi:SAM-dependent methyltransferase
MIDKWIEGKILSSKILPDFFEIKPDETVVNIGCGNSPQAVVYANKFKEMVGVDINKERLKTSEEVAEYYKVKRYKTLCANVENIPLPDKSFDKALAIDIIEHVENPQKLCSEIRRLLKEDGKMLVTFPTMHDKYTRFFSSISRMVKRKKVETRDSTAWDPDEHNNEFSLEKWIEIVEESGFELVGSRATTMFPPLHIYGIPRFWYSNNTINKIDGFFCRMSFFKKYGQTSACIFRKKPFDQITLNENKIETRFKNQAKSKTFKNIISKFNLKNKSVLDIGCSYGEFLVHFGEGSLGLSISEEEVAYGKKKGLNIVYGNIEYDEVEIPGKYDVIFANNILEHLYSPHDFLIKIKRYLKEDGFLILGVPCAPTLKPLIYLDKFKGSLAVAHINFFTKYTLEKTVERAGWKVIEVGGFHFFNTSVDKLLNPIYPHFYVVARPLSEFKYHEKRIKELKGYTKNQ